MTRDKASVNCDTCSEGNLTYGKSQGWEILVAPNAPICLTFEDKVGTAISFKTRTGKCSNHDWKLNGG